MLIVDFRITFGKNWRSGRIHFGKKDEFFKIKSELGRQPVVQERVDRAVYVEEYADRNIDEPVNLQLDHLPERVLVAIKHKNQIPYLQRKQAHVKRHNHDDQHEYELASQSNIIEQAIVRVQKIPISNRVLAQQHELSLGRFVVAASSI